MDNDNICSFHIFGAGRGESILIELLNNTSGKSDFFIIDTYSTKPFDSPEKNPIIAYQYKTNFPWEQVVAICLSHPHADHFTGLAAVARKAVNAVWMRPTLTPLDSFIKHYDTIAKVKGFKKSTQPAKRWIVDSIREIAEWGKSAHNFCCIANKNFDPGNNDFSIQIIAPEDNIAADYTRKLHDNIDDQLMNESDESPKNLHNIASTGIIIDLKNGERILLLGDMVEESWSTLLKPGNSVYRILQDKKASIIKLPHHCSTGAIFKDLLTMTCDPEKTIAVFTPFSYSRSIPSIQSLEEVAPYVKELYGTVDPPDKIEWKCKSKHGFFCDKITESYVKNPETMKKNPVDCRVSVYIANDGQVKVTCGESAFCFK